VLVTGRRVLPAVLGIACLAFLLGVSTRADDRERPTSAGQQLDALMAQQPSAVVTTDRDPSRLLRSQRSKAAPLLVLAVLLAAVATTTGRPRRAPLAGARPAGAVGTDPAAARAPPR